MQFWEEKTEKSITEPDSKSQITIEYSDDKKPIKIKAIVISTQHDNFDIEEVMLERIKTDIKEY